MTRRVKDEQSISDNQISINNLERLLNYIKQCPIDIKYKINHIFIDESIVSVKFFINENEESEESK